MNMEAPVSSETLLPTWPATRSHISEDYCRQNTKYYTASNLWNVSFLRLSATNYRLPNQKSVSVLDSVASSLLTPQSFKRRISFRCQLQ